VGCQLKEFDRDTIKKLFTDQGFINTRCYQNKEAKLSYPKDYTLVLGAFPYEHQNAPEKKGMGMVAPFARSNYYREAVCRLKKIVSVIRQETGISKNQVKIFVNSNLPEKEIAAAAGVGFIGKNSLILLPKTGSFVILGGLILPFSLEPDAPLPGGLTPGEVCGSCTNCIKACPTGAILPGGKIRQDRCLQAQMQTYTLLDPDIMEALGKRIYGCNICQDVCPYNTAPHSGIPCGRGKIGPHMEIDFLLTAAPEEIKTGLKGTALGMSWLDPRAIKRNAVIAAGNSNAPRYRKMLSALIVNDTDKIISRTARWAMRQNKQNTV
jgi:epoxyqueuosine reductase